MASSSTSAAPQAGAQKPIYFWREYGSPHCIYSQWYLSPFTDPKTGTHYKTAEQYMMHQKALLFSDPAIAAKILQTTSPKEQKSLGRKVKNFKDSTWVLHRSRIVEEGSYLKFKYGQDKGELEGKGLSLKERLLQTGEKELVEASPMDRVWGIGFTERWAEERMGEWGLNLLGKALGKARERLMAEEKEAGAKTGEGKGKESKFDDIGLGEGIDTNENENDPETVGDAEAVGQEAEKDEERPKKRTRRDRKT
ncbi:uncharacterized protein PAC_11878 [Phialocephala subalpina]|uniref:NADAR domain-containing protein n=1 Tax=Phialocephala subalpina TaxID=576137 RepID=A0A1L7XAC9_9HELO|nr:uncharacterized protein PAC_11878 [Phialocephala subalpina]